MNPSEALLAIRDGEPPIAEDSTTPSSGVKHLKQLQRRLPAEQIMDLVRQYEDGALASELAEQFGIHESTAHAHIKQHTRAPRPYRKLKGDQRTRAIELYASGLSVRAVARELGVNKATVTAVLVEAGVAIRPFRKEAPT